MVLVSCVFQLPLVLLHQVLVKLPVEAEEFLLVVVVKVFNLNGVLSSGYE
jgi:hypothetical protein